MIRIYTAKHCQPCHEIEDLIKEGKFSGETEVEVIDIETDDGFLRFKEEVLQFSDGAVPSAYKNGKKCLIHIDEEKTNIVLSCPTDEENNDIILSPTDEKG